MKKSPMVGHLILKTYSNFANAKEQQKILYIFIIYYCISQSGWQAGIIILGGGAGTGVLPPNFLYPGSPGT